MAADALSSVGYHTVQAASGVEALNAWYSHDEKIDLLFTDLVMPEAIPGEELAQRLRARKPGLKVVLTSGHSAGLRERAAGSGGAIFIPKPYSASVLLQTVRGCFEPSPAGSA